MGNAGFWVWSGRSRSFNSRTRLIGETTRQKKLALHNRCFKRQVRRPDHAPLSDLGEMPTKRLKAPEAADGGQKKKARTQDPGIRVQVSCTQTVSLVRVSEAEALIKGHVCLQGGRIYDSETGTTCHQVSD